MTTRHIVPPQLAVGEAVKLALRVGATLRILQDDLVIEHEEQPEKSRLVHNMLLYLKQTKGIGRA